MLWNTNSECGWLTKSLLSPVVQNPATLEIDEIFNIVKWSWIVKYKGGFGDFLQL